MKATELSGLGAEELEVKLAEAKEELFNLRFQNVTGQLDNYRRLGEVRKDIARIFTAMRQRELLGADEPEPEPEMPAAAPRRRRARKE